ncbi:Tyrosine-protein kinase Shark [Gryllus bimaculatus]|nr:Tyrosine-protein kinase Shark [Gryllus bimaculatus]
MSSATIEKPKYIAAEKVHFLMLFKRLARTMGKEEVKPAQGGHGAATGSAGGKPPSADPKATKALLAAAEGGRAAEVARLLDGGCDPNARDGSATTAGSARRGRNGGGRLHRRVNAAARTRHALLAVAAARAPPRAPRSDAHGKTPLHLAASRPVESALRAALPHRNGHSALHLAAWAGRAEAARALLARGADVAAVDRCGRTPLHLAAEHGQAECVGALVGAGAAVAARDKDEWTPLHFAAKWGREDAARALLAAGADRALRSNCGRAPKDVAETDAMRKLLSD